MSDPSAKTTKQMVLIETLQHPLTLYPSAVGILGSLTAALFGPTVLTTGAVVGGLTVGVGSWVINYFLRSETFANAHLRALHDALENKKKRALKDLATNLRAVRTVPGAEEYADQAGKQLGMIQERFDNFRELLLGKLNPNELTFGRLYVTAEQVLLAVLDNLQSISTRLHSIKTIEVSYIEDRLRSLHKQKSTAQADIEEVETLKKRMALRQDQLDKVNGILTYNEKALTELDQVNTAIAEMKVGKGQASMDLESATRELEELAKRAQQFTP